jgi:hypothetical protein
MMMMFAAFNKLQKPRKRIESWKGHKHMQYMENARATNNMQEDECKRKFTNERMKIKMRGMMKIQKRRLQ